MPRGQTRISIANTRRLLFAQINSWMTGINTNVGGKQKRTILVYACISQAVRRGGREGLRWVSLRVQFEYR
jgi:hypothetical protein